ncbi:MAG: hypothetical protein ABEJ05_11715 [Haloglomus sp.]
MRNALRPVVLAAADFGIGSLLYQHVSAPLGVVLVVAGLFVLCSAGYETLSHGRSVLQRRFPRPAGE